MDRREAIKLGLGFTAGATLGSTVGCAPGAREVAQGDSPVHMDLYLANLDSQLEKIRGARFVEGFAAESAGKPLTSAMRESIAPSENLFRKMLHTLMLSQSFRDLSEEGRYHPGMQKRMAENFEAMDATVFEVNDMLAKLSPEQRDATRETLRKHPGLAMRLGESLDEQAALAGVASARRLQLRSIMTQTSFRLSKHDPGVVIDEYVNKVRRATAPGKAEIAASQSAGYVGSEAFWRYRDRMEKPKTSNADTAETSAFNESKFDGPGSGAVKTGAKMMGIGAITFGVSAIFVANDAFPFVIGMTVGAVLFAIGLITLIVGAIIVAAN
jgi:hypothetical protein